MRKIAVIGAGQMGTGIAQTVAANGMQVILSDIDLATVARLRTEGQVATRRDWPEQFAS